MLTKCRTRPQYVLWSNRGFSVQHPRVKHHQYQRHNNHNALRENGGHDDDAIALRGDAVTAQANDRQGGARILMMMMVDVLLRPRYIVERETKWIHHTAVSGTVVEAVCSFSFVCKQSVLHKLCSHVAVW